MFCRVSDAVFPWVKWPIAGRIVHLKKYLKFLHIISIQILLVSYSVNSPSSIPDFLYLLRYQRICVIWAIYHQSLFLVNSAIVSKRIDEEGQSPQTWISSGPKKHFWQYKKHFPKFCKSFLFVKNEYIYIEHKL